MTDAIGAIRAEVKARLTRQDRPELLGSTSDLYGKLPTEAHLLLEKSVLEATEPSKQNKP